MWRKFRKDVSVLYSLIFLFSNGPAFFEILGKFAQCWENMYNVAAAFVAAGYYQKVNPFKIKIPEEMLFRRHCIGFFLCNVVCGLLDNIALNFCLCKVVPRVLRHYWTGFFLVQCFPDPQWHHCLGCLPVQCYPNSINTSLNRIFPVHCWLEPQGQLCIGFWPVQGCL